MAVTVEDTSWYKVWCLHTTSSETTPSLSLANFGFLRKMLPIVEVEYEAPQCPKMALSCLRCSTTALLLYGRDCSVESPSHEISDAFNISTNEASL